MNDFTKEELIEVHEYCNAWKGLGMSDFRVNLWDKIQILIDNYCAHEKVDPCSDLKTQCRDCGDIL